MQTSFVLCQGVSSNSNKKWWSYRVFLSPGLADSLVNESLQAGSSVLDEVLLKYAVVTAEGKLSFHRLAGQGWHHDLAISLKLISQPLEVGISPANAGLLHSEDWQVGLNKGCCTAEDWRRGGVLPSV